MNSSNAPFCPRYVALDTSTWVKLLRHRTDPVVKDIIDVLNSGRIIPYVCLDHLVELLQYEDQKTREQRLDFFDEIKLIGYPRHCPSPPWPKSTICASYLDVQEFEISALLNDPSLTLEQIVDRVKPDALAGLSKGAGYSVRPSS